MNLMTKMPTGVNNNNSATKSTSFLCNCGLLFGERKLFNDHVIEFGCGSPSSNGGVGGAVAAASVPLRISVGRRASHSRNANVRNFDSNSEDEQQKSSSSSSSQQQYRGGFAGARHGSASSSRISSNGSAEDVGMFKVILLRNNIVN